MSLLPARERLIQLHPLHGEKEFSHSGRDRLAQVCELRDLLRPVVAECEHKDLLVDLVVAFESLHRAAAGVCQLEISCTRLLIDGR